MFVGERRTFERRWSTFSVWMPPSSSKAATAMVFIPMSL